ncbi:glycosyltransferase family 2 protein [Acidipila sp. EB88]|uniref:glycosyltransferase family 2 protein n=1 Tax=Acidipila sp. EB88 TaxID=2305226 RepID=UPI001F23FEA0|nr:glycosyltransferase family 2 protein [Acidipila sp. EB88]
MTPLPRSPWLLLALGCSLGPLLTFAVNLAYYRAPRRPPQGSATPVEAEQPTQTAISVLIPARNEEAGIAAACRSVLASTGTTLELLVLDDASSDRTAEEVLAIAARDPRLTLHSAPPLAAGWNGKQHACSVLSSLAHADVLCFLDADVRLQPDALATLLHELASGQSDLISGFPYEETRTWLEQILIPLIHFVLLCYLPMPGLRHFPRIPSLAAGCGQIMLVRREAYRASGGHAAIRATMHDGILLPALLRKAGYATDLFDFTALATCRMYRNAREVWCGLGKNATEGMATPARILPFTIMLLFGQVVPAAWFATSFVTGGPLLWASIALAAGYIPRAVAMVRFRQSLFGAALHPVGVAALLVLQWYALAAKLRGRQTTWKERVYRLG